MKTRTRNSSIKPKRKHGFRSKPRSHTPRKHKKKPGGHGNKRSRTVR